MKHFLFFALFALILMGCGEKRSSDTAYSIGRDPMWFPLQLDGKAININGFTNALVQEISQVEKINIQIIDTDWLSLIDGLEEKQYAAIFSSLPPNIENRNQYSFSNPFLLLGPVLVVPSESDMTSLKQLEGKIVGVSQFDDSVLIVQKYPSIVIRLYQNMPTALGELVSGDLDGILLPTLDAHALVSNLYPDQLKIVTEPLNNKALRLITLKGEHQKLINRFNKGIEELSQSNSYNQLREKFGIKT